MVIDSRDAIIIFSFLFLSIDHSIGRFFFFFCIFHILHASVLSVFPSLEYNFFHSFVIQVHWLYCIYKLHSLIYTKIRNTSEFFLYFSLVMLQSFLCFKLWNIISFIPLLFKFVGFIASKLHSLIHKNKKLHNCFLI